MIQIAVKHFARPVVSGIIFRLKRTGTSAVILSRVLVLSKHSNDRREIMSREIPRSGGLVIPYLKPVVAKYLTSLELLLWPYASLRREQWPLTPVVRCSPPLMSHHIFHKYIISWSFCYGHHWIFLIGVQIMIPPSLVSQHSVRQYLSHLSRVAMISAA